MEDQVPFKVFTFWNENSKPEVRRFGIEKSVVTSFHYINAKLQDVFPGLKNKSYSVTWKDEDGDQVTISSDDEIMVALGSMRDDVVKLYVYCKQDANDVECEIFVSAFSEASGDNKAKHYGVVCDNCNSEVVGFRYKCTSCHDFDLCSKCESSGAHPEHCMVRVPAPIMPRDILRSAIKRSRQFLKTIPGGITGDCPYKRHRRERSGDSKHREGEHHKAHHSGDRHRNDAHYSGDRQRGDHHRRPRPGWLDIFANYMNEFANLAGDIDLDNDKKGPATAQEKPAPGPSTQGNKPENSKTQKGEETPSLNQSNRNEPNHGDQCPMSPDMLTENVMKVFASYFGGNMSAFMPQTSPPNKNNDVEMGQGDRKTSDAEMTQQGRKNSEAGTSVKSGVSSASDTARKDASPDRVDDWTMINKEKDLDNFLTASAPVEATPPIGFNLPQEFTQCVNITEPLYPPLNTATAVLNPNDGENQNVAPPTPPQPRPQPQGLGATALPPQNNSAQNKPQHTRTYHPMAHIHAAIEQMLAMGFTNEGGWLTQLLENKDGNIAAVLDLLTPVSPKK